MEKMFQLNPEIKNHKGEVVLCGTAAYDKRTFTMLLKEHVYVSALLTDDEQWIGSRFMNKPVLGLEQKDRFLNPIFITSQYELAKKMEENGVDGERIYCVGSYRNDESSPERTTRARLWLLLETAKKRKIIIYGDTKAGRELECLLRLCDVEIAYIVDEGNDAVKSVWDIMYENPDEILVIIAKEEKEQCEKNLQGMGLKAVVEYRDINFLASSYQTEFWMDVQLGHTWKIDDQEECGIKIYGNLESDAPRIVTLGGSTTDPRLFPFKCWSEFLYENFKRDGIDVTVICAGCSSYTASQELLKLERDLLQFSPALVISYSGVNDINFDDEYKFASQYQREVYGSIRNYYGKNSQMGNVYNGAKNRYSAFDWWLMCEKMMWGICNAFNIPFFGILQALFGGKQDYTSYEKEILLNDAIHGKANESDFESYKKQREFREKSQHLSKQDAPFFCNMVDLLDSEEAFFDHCHVTEKGNYIIAKTIYQKIMEDKLI